MNDACRLIIIIISIIFCLFISYTCYSRSYFSNIRHEKVFRTPPSFTKLSIPEAKTKEFELSVGYDTTKKDTLDRYHMRLTTVIANNRTILDSVNIIQLPTFFNSNEKWPGCLPRPLYQGSCGSCWGFASVTCLSARFYIESCGNSECGNYPQINNGSIDDVYTNLNAVYNFNKIYLKNFTDYVDLNNDGTITKYEWMKAIDNLNTQLWKLPKENRDRYYISQLLVNILDFQSLGSFNLKSIRLLDARAELTFSTWLEILNTINKENKKTINTKQLLEYWRKQPLSLSAEKLITCCSNCYILEFSPGASKTINNPVCVGGSLTEAWTLLRDIGTPETLCIGYGLDDYVLGDTLSTCRNLQGPFFSFCGGYRFKDEVMPNDVLNKEVNETEDTGAYPPAVPHESKYPWVDPQLIRFKAKNAYTVSNNIIEIQREIIQRGPVNSGFYIYNDFEVKFGGIGKGGQLYTGTNPIGSDSNCLVYMRDPELKDKPTGGHAVTIVGWGTFLYTRKGIEYEIPYWTCLNTWGAEWGHSGFANYSDRTNVPEKMNGGGYFWIVRGINNCGIEENVIAGQPNIENLSYPGIIDKYGWGADPPNVNNPEITFLPAYETENKEVNSKRLVISDTLIGGGGYVDFVPPFEYNIKSMIAPSPFTMFWQETRPVYCIGHTLSELKEEDVSEVKVSESVMWFIMNIRNGVYKNPLLLIGDDDGQEQVQLLRIEGDTIGVQRGVNFNIIQKHSVNSRIKVFPYQDLSIVYLDKNGFKKCE